MRHVLISILILFGTASASGATPVHGLLATMVGPLVGNESIEAADHVSPTKAPTDIHASDSEIFRRFGPESDAVTGHVHFRSTDIMSGLRQDRGYGDDPGGSLWLIPVNWDARTGSLIPIQAIFGELPENEPAYAAIAIKLRKALIQQVWSGTPENWAQAIKDRVAANPMALSVFTFIPSTIPDRIGGIGWNFEPEPVAPRARGVISSVSPQEQLRDVIRPEWKELFAGEPAPIPPAQQMLEAEKLAGIQRSH